MYALAIHGGAGTLPAQELRATRQQALREGLAAALAAGQRVLAADGSALDAIEAAVIALEDDPAFNAARGAVLTAEATIELDAAVMDGTTLRAGAVAQLRHVKNPVRLARAILDHLPHVFMVGEGAERYASELGLARVDNDYFMTAARSEQLAAATPPTGPQPARPPPRCGQGASPPAGGFGTVGAVARDRHGRLAAATSTGGTTGKRIGRVGDSPVIGAGTYADDETCAVSATGDGEWLLRTVTAYDIAARLRYARQTLRAAVEEVVGQRLAALDARGGVIAVDASGEIVMLHNTRTMLRASVREAEEPYLAIL